jgi:hypothetical protein
MRRQEGPKIVIDDVQPNEAITFRSQPKVFFRILGIAFGLGGIMVMGILYLNDLRILHINDAFQMTWKQYAGIAIGFPIFYVFSCFLILSQPGLGAYRVDGQGIEQTGFLKERKYLRWQDAERVKWNKDMAIFEGKGVSITILWTLISTKDETPARQFLEKVLSPCFNLSIKTMSRRVFHRRLIGLYVSGAAVLFGMFIGFPFLDGRLRFQVEIAWFVLSIGACLVMTYLSFFKDKRVSEQLDPPWRLRRKDDEARPSQLKQQI